MTALRDGAVSRAGGITVLLRGASVGAGCRRDGYVGRVRRVLAVRPDVITVVEAVQPRGKERTREATEISVWPTITDAFE